MSCCSPVSFPCCLLSWLCLSTYSEAIPWTIWSLSSEKNYTTIRNWSRPRPPSSWTSFVLITTAIWASSQQWLGSWKSFWSSMVLGSSRRSWRRLLEQRLVIIRSSPGHASASSYPFLRRVFLTTRFVRDRPGTHWLLIDVELYLHTVNRNSMQSTERTHSWRMILVITHSNTTLR